MFHEEYANNVNVNMIISVRDMPAVLAVFCFSKEACSDCVNILGRFFEGLGESVEYLTTTSVGGVCARSTCNLAVRSDAEMVVS
jgi:predicted DNA-binding ArsR family transcriptional regulator